ncbi:hypothetical protein MesoLj113b_32770 [Mesorhizobium sp. 113-3-3]|nr:hypothetical protein MesoLj113b_32770 [Mesorhizobium sp. 113-3-3]
MLLELFRFIQPVQGFTWAYVGYNAAIVVVARAPMELRSTLLEGKLLAGKIVEFLSAEIKIPTFVTVAKEYGPGSPHFLLSTPGVFKAVYADLQRAPAQLKAAFAYASAALPLGILPEMTIDGKTFVDGGVADNTPITPILGQDVDEIWLISLSPTLFDLKDHMRNVLMQAIFVEGPPQISAEAYSAALSHFDKIKLVVFSPPTDLGNMLMGTLNFNAKRTNALMVLGERTAERVLRSGTGYSSRIYRLNYKFWTRLRLIRRALPPCSVVHPYKRSNISDLTKSEFEFPDVRVKPDEAGRPSWHASVIVLWSIYLGNSINSGWQSILWATLFGLVGLSLPTWRARMRRNLDK